MIVLSPYRDGGLNSNPKAELGKHGSLIHRELGANFRLACVLTDLPLLADRPDVFGGDDFCASCRICADACPPDAIAADKQLVRGVRLVKKLALKR